MTDEPGPESVQSSPQCGDLALTECCSCRQVTQCTYAPDEFAYETHYDDSCVWECRPCRAESAAAI
jgi:hypothetical protein